MPVLGIDPGLTTCGYAVLRAEGSSTKALSIGTITTDKALSLPERLADLQQDISEIIQEHSPEVMALEKVVFASNAKTAMSVGQASGIAMATASAAGCEVVEYTPNEIKQAVASWGHADKKQVAEMVKILLGLDQPPQPADAADACAVALCYMARAPERIAREKIR